jgi:hypothetical protein
MAKRPAGVDRETWLRERERVWAQRNRVISILMLVAAAALLIRYCGS